MRPRNRVETQTGDQFDTLMGETKKKTLLHTPVVNERPHFSCPIVFTLINFSSCEVDGDSFSREIRGRFLRNFCYSEQDP